MTQPGHSEASQRVQPLPDRSNLLHDIGNHLHGLQGVVQLMSIGVTRIGQRDAIQLAQGSLRLLEKQLELLQASVAGRLSQAQIENTDCAELVARVCAMYTPVAQADGIRLTARSKEVPARLETDPVGLARLVSNLVLNAIRHSGGDEVTVEVQSGPSSLQVLVTDNGRGLPDGVSEWVHRLQEGSGVPAEYRRNGLLSCFEIARAANFGLELLDTREQGVRWRVSMPFPATGANPLDERRHPAEAPAKAGAGLVNVLLRRAEARRLTAA